MRFRVEAALVLGLGGALWLSAGCSSEDASESAACESQEALSYESFGGPFFLNWCTGCHSSKIPKGARQEAPLDVNFDSLDDIRAHRGRIVDKAVNAHKMPPAGGPNDDERKLLGQWLGCGAPSLSEGFTPAEPPPLQVDPPPTGECAEPQKPLADSMLPRCASTTADCVAVCALEDEAYIEDCRDACIAADTTTPDSGVDCQGCVFNQLLACAGEKGCQKQSAKFVCCAQDCGTDACIESECQEAVTAFSFCIGYQAEVCYDFTGPYIGKCFAP